MPYERRSSCPNTEFGAKRTTPMATRMMTIPAMIGAEFSTLLLDHSACVVPGRRRRHGERAGGARVVAADPKGVRYPIDVVEPARDERDLQNAAVVEPVGPQTVERFTRHARC